MRWDRERDRVKTTRRYTVAAVIGAGACLLVGTASANTGPVYRTITTPDPGPSAHALVSWYGPGFYGRHTASGAVLTLGMMNAAHKHMRLGTMVTFYYGGKRACAVVNDRGPYIYGREFDLGPGTAVSLGFGGVGTVGWRYGCGTKTVRVRVSVCRKVVVANKAVRRCAKSWPVKR